MSAPTTDHAAVRQILASLVLGGWIPQQVWDGEEFYEALPPEKAVDDIMSVDASTVYVKHFVTGEEGWVFFVLGNEPYEVAADYTVNLFSAIDPVTERWWDQ